MRTSDLPPRFDGPVRKTLWNRSSPFWERYAGILRGEGRERPSENRVNMVGAIGIEPMTSPV